MKTTLQDIAQQTGLSVSTVSRALHHADSPNVSAATRRRVSEAAQRSGYRPNLAARILSTGRSHTMAYWTFDAFTPYYSMVARRISAEAMDRGYIVVMNSSADPEHLLTSNDSSLRVHPALHSGSDGIIACDVAYPGNDYAALLRSLNIPLVGIGLNYPVSSDFVGIDLYGTACEATEHLVAAGCQRIGLMCNEHAWAQGDPRAKAYTDVMHAAGFKPEPILIPRLSRAPARDITAQLAREGRLPDAIFCLNDEVAVGCYRGLCDEGLHVPDDIMLVGCDGTEEAAYLPCPITSIVPPIAELCRLAWDFLEARIENPNAPLRQTVLAPTLAIRESSGGDTESPVPPC